ncbi:MAG TPA: phosphotransferase family protein [Micromonosporaceae bacterium]|jgi:aminoglycoside phosphotransferase (APT) family kinase protein
MSTDLDPASEVREEDAFDVAAVASWLRSHVDDATGLDQDPTVRQFPAGVSNLTYLLRYPERDLILRRPPAGTKARGAHDVRREYDVQRLLRPTFGYVPEVLAFCDDPTVIGSDFSVMARIEGRILRRDLPPGMTLTPEQAASLCRVVIDRLVDLHRVDPVATGLQRFGRGEGYVARQVAGWSDRYRRARTADVGAFDPIMAWLAANQPSDTAHCVIHNDYRLDNIVLDPDDPLHVVGILDWEMATVGDPFMDLGGSLAYWAQTDDDPAFRRLRRQPTTVPGMLTRAQIVEYYAQRSGRPISAEQWLFYEVFGLFRLAVIAQQVYYRYVHAQTTNPAFAELRQVVTALEQRTERLIGENA